MNKRFRLCAVCYLSYRYSSRPNIKFTEGFFISQDIPDKNLFIKKNVFITELPETKEIPAEIISCAFDTDGLHGRFFLTDDPYSTQSAFLAEAYWQESDSNHAISDAIRYFELRDKFTNIRALKAFDD